MTHAEACRLMARQCLQKALDLYADARGMGRKGEFLDAMEMFELVSKEISMALALLDREGEQQ